jgi:hypothetical protein
MGKVIDITEKLIEKHIKEAVEMVAQKAEEYGAIAFLDKNGNVVWLDPESGEPIDDLNF